MNEKKVVITGLSSKVDALASKKSIVRKFDLPKTIVGKLECDHIVEIGVAGYEDPYLIILLFSGKKFPSEYFLEEYKPKHCPECGEKLTTTK
jgi:hypothetical protein